MYDTWHQLSKSLLNFMQLQITLELVSVLFTQSKHWIFTMWDEQAFRSFVTLLVSSPLSFIYI